MDETRLKMIREWIELNAPITPCNAPADCEICGRDEPEWWTCPCFAADRLRDLLAENQRLQVKLDAFHREWATRFGFLQTEHPVDSIESIDAVAILLNEERERAEELRRRIVMEEV